MNPRDTPLREATMHQLVEELARRQNATTLEEPPHDRWCDECVHFRTGTTQTVMRKDYNPCAKRHAMEFYTPQPWDSPDCFGYYTLVCADREPIPPPVPPAPPPPIPRAPRGSKPTKVK